LELSRHIIYKIESTGESRGGRCNEVPNLWAFGIIAGSRWATNKGKLPLLRGVLNYLSSRFAARAAGISDHIWTIEKIVSLIAMMKSFCFKREPCCKFCLFFSAL